MALTTRVCHHYFRARWQARTRCDRPLLDLQAYDTLSIHTQVPWLFCLMSHPGKATHLHGIWLTSVQNNGSHSLKKQYCFVYCVYWLYIFQILNFKYLFYCHICPSGPTEAFNSCSSRSDVCQCLVVKPLDNRSKNKPSISMTHVDSESKLCSVVRSSMHPCPRNRVATGSVVVYHAQVARAFSAGTRFRHCIVWAVHIITLQFLKYKKHNNILEKMSSMRPYACTVYCFNLQCYKSRFTCLLKSICATLNSRIQALKLYSYYYIVIYLEDVILALLWGAQKKQISSSCKKNTLYSIWVMH